MKLTSRAVCCALQRLIGKEARASRKHGGPQTHALTRYLRAMKEVGQGLCEIESMLDLMQVRHIGYSIATAILREIEEGGQAAGEEAPTASRCADFEASPPAPSSAKSRKTTASAASSGRPLHSAQITVNGAKYRIPAMFSVPQVALLALHEAAKEEGDPSPTPSHSVLKYRAIDHVKRRQEVYEGASCITACTEKKIKDAATWLKKRGLCVPSADETMQLSTAGLLAAELLQRAFSHREKREWVVPAAPPECGTVKILVDNRERRGKGDSFYFQSRLSTLSIPAETRQLTLSDFVWVREREGQELFAGTVLERKTIPDLLSSLRDGRYREQKGRLQALERARKIYLIEGTSSPEGYAETTVFTVALKLAQQGFLVLLVDCIEETVHALHHLHKCICAEQKAQPCPDEEHFGATLRKAEKKKVKDMGPREATSLHLQTIKGIGAAVAEAISSKFCSLGKMAAHPYGSRAKLQEEVSAIKYIHKGRPRRVGAKNTVRVLDALGM